MLFKDLIDDILIVVVALVVYDSIKDKIDKKAENIEI